MAGLAAGTASAAEKVTVDNFVRAETDLTMKRYAAQGAFGKFLHIRGMTPIDEQDVSTAYGQGGNPKEAAVYQNGVPALNDGKTPYALTVRDAPVDGCWSITVYNAKGFMEPNPLNAYSVNDVTAKRNPDGSVTIHFGGDPGSVNYRRSPRGGAR